MIQITPQMRVVVLIGPVDGRCGIDGLAGVCREREVSGDPLDGTLFVFRTRSGKSIKLLAYDGQGFWLCQKRMSTSKFKYWPTAADSSSAASRELLAHQLQTLIWGGDPEQAQAAPMWRRIPLDAQESRPS
jgi:transposase